MFRQRPVRNGQYIAINAFVTNDAHNTNIYYTTKDDSTLIRRNVISDRKTVWGRLLFPIDFTIPGNREQWTPRVGSAQN